MFHRYEARAVACNPSAFTKIAPLTYRPPRIAAAIAKECAEILFQVSHAARAWAQLLAYYAAPAAAAAADVAVLMM